MTSPRPASALRPRRRPRRRRRAGGRRPTATGTPRRPRPGNPAPAPPPPSGYGPTPAPPPAYGGAGYGYTPYATASGTNGMAIASLVLGILWLYWIGSILALIFGYVALGQLKQRPQAGRGMAIAGIVLGWVGVALLVVGIIGLAAGS